MSNAIILISCSDQKGITASVTDFVFKNGGNIIHADQHIDDQMDVFFMRIEWSLDGFAIDKNHIAAAFEPIADKFNMRWNLYFSDDRPNMAIFVSQHLHCLYDILYRYRAGQLLCDIPVVISNHEGAKHIAKEFRIRFHEVPKAKDNKAVQEKRELEILKKEKIDFIVLARYHQIFTEEFVNQYENRMINIHHSFLPAFAGKDPYNQAYQKGVKIIGATSHYVTKDLDEGPIIEQDTVRVSHRHSLEDLKRMGEDLERIVLNRALRWHLDRKVLVYNNKTVVFD